MLRNDRHCQANENQRYLHKQQIITTQMFKNIVNSMDTVIAKYMYGQRGPYFFIFFIIADKGPEGH